MTAYIVAIIDIQDPEAYKKYTARTPDVVANHGGRFLIRGSEPEVLEGEWDLPRLVLLEFDDLAAARSFYRSADYQEILPLRLAASQGKAAIFDGAPS